MQAMTKTLGSILKYSVSVALAAALIWLACRGIEWEEFLLGLKATRWGWIVLFFIAAYLAIVFRSFRWKQLLRPIDEGIHYGRVFDATNIGAMVSIAIPGSGEFVRCGLIAKAGVPFQTVFGTIIMERAWDFFAVGVMFVLALVTGWGRFGGFFVDNIWHPLTSHNIIIWALALLAALAILAVFAVYKLKDRSRTMARLYDLLEGFLTGFKTFGKIRNKGWFLLNTVGIWVMYMLMSYFVLKAVPGLSGLEMADGLFVSAIGNVASLVPVPGGIGAYHYLLKVSLMTLYGTSEEIGLLFATLCHELHAVVVIILGVWSYLMRIVILRNRKN